MKLQKAVWPLGHSKRGRNKRGREGERKRLKKFSQYLSSSVMCVLIQYKWKEGGKKYYYWNWRNALDCGRVRAIWGFLTGLKRDCWFAEGTHVCLARNDMHIWVFLSFSVSFFSFTFNDTSSNTAQKLMHSHTSAFQDYQTQTYKFYSWDRRGKRRIKEMKDWVGSTKQ